MADTSRVHVMIRGVQPEIECGRFSIKRSAGEEVEVEADVFAYGHDAIACVLRYRHEQDTKWEESPMAGLANDHWRGRFVVTRLGTYRYTLSAWVDHFQTWWRDLKKRVAAGQDVTVDLQSGATLLKVAAARAAGDDARILSEAAAALTPELALSESLAALAARYPVREFAANYKELRVTVERERARFSTWYELFPRSTSPDPDAHGTFRDCEKWLPAIAGMGFDIVYLPPIHPIGRSHRKGRNNNPAAAPGDPGSPWAIGAAEGGHKAVNPALGTLDDFRHLVQTASGHGMEIALDLAYQCSPDHPYIKQHPEWFRWRPDGTVQYAENPPKKYEDIYPFEFDTAHWQTLWNELKSIVEFWVEQGVRVFRVDNPHTKPFAFWEWMIADLKAKHPELIFLSEAFTRPNIMYWLAKLGFSQSYTYFTWRNTKQELTEYLTELTQSEVREFFRPNFWPNTPDILHEYLQEGGRPAFITRLVLAATLAANYGMYGPAFEMLQNVAKQKGSEEYLNSEKYEIKHHRFPTDDTGLRGLITRVNEIRRTNAALQSDSGLQFHAVDNEQLIAYSKRTADNQNIVVMVVNLDYRYTQSGFLDLPLAEFGISERRPYTVTDLLTGAQFSWQGPRNYVELRPREIPAHILLLDTAEHPTHETSRL
jgi:starch synthase (maltosyl-transferring)